MKTFVFFIAILFIVSCSVNKKPIFVKVDGIKIAAVTADTVRLKANAIFKNPNDIGGKLVTDEIKVIVNEVEVAQVSSAEFKVPARDEFSIPLKVAIPTTKIFRDTKNGFLGGLINSILSKSVKVQFKGDLKYTILGFSDVYAIDKTENIQIKL